MGERLVCNQEAIGSIPFTSTILRSKSEGHTVFELRMASHPSLFERRMPYEAPSVGLMVAARSEVGQLNGLRMAYAIAARRVKDTRSSSYGWQAILPPKGAGCR